MKESTKIIIFLIVAFTIVIVITFATRSVEAPVTIVTPTTTSTATYTLAQVVQHKTPTDCWTTISGGVYNLTPFIPQHPGGDKILVVCGKDGTTAFMGQHGANGDIVKGVENLRIGTLAK